MKPSDFIALIGPSAQASAARSGVPASVTVAQAALESAWGESQLAKQGRNLFGIKADDRWTGDTIAMPTREVIDGREIMVTARFRAYPDWQGSLDDHAAFLRDNRRYAAAFATTDGERFAEAIAAAGYATDPAYADKLIGIMRQYGLAEFDRGTPVAVPEAGPAADEAPAPAGSGEFRWESQGGAAPIGSHKPEVAGSTPAPATDPAPAYEGPPFPFETPSYDPQRKPMLPQIAIALGAELIKLLPAFGSGSRVSDRNIAVTQEVAGAMLRTAREIVPTAPNEQAMVEQILRSPELQQRFRAQAAVKWEEIAPFLRHEEESRQSARTFAESMTSSGPLWRAIGFGAILLLLAGGVVYGGGWMLREVLQADETDLQTRGMIIGAIIAAVMQVLSYFFGSSASSRSKDQALSEAAKR